MPDIAHDPTPSPSVPDVAPPPFAAFAAEMQPQSALRSAVARAERRPEPELLPPLLDAARLPDALAGPAQALARRLVEALRRKPGRGIVEALIQEFSLSSQEGVALMCLAEALLRIPDTGTRDALIRDKIGKGDWQAHAGGAPSLFIHAATWGLMITGKLVATSNEASLANALTRLIARGGEPLIRKGLDIGMRLMGEQFVSGETIAKALNNGRRFEARGFSYSYDMLGEAATIDEDARRYYAAYEQAIHAIGKASAGRGTRAMSARSGRACWTNSCRACAGSPCLRAATTSAFPSMPRRPIASGFRWIFSKRFASTQRSTAGRASASSCRRTSRPRRSRSTA